MAAEKRLRHYLARDEVTALLRAAKQTKRYGARNHAMILLAYRHGLRASELVELRLCDLDLRARTILCRRRKGSKSSVHPMKTDEVEAVERVIRSRGDKGREFVFSSERGEKLGRGAFWRIVSEAGKRAGLPVKAYAHMLRHACGYYLANKGCDLRLIQDYLGHKQIHYLPPQTMSRCRRIARVVAHWRHSIGT
jgi:site-specific recombinase XerD